jgi:hypothetical protein
MKLKKYLIDTAFYFLEEYLIQTHDMRPGMVYVYYSNVLC